MLATFGLILFINEGVTMLFGRQPLFVAMPQALSGAVEIIPGVPYPTYRLVVIAVGLLVAFALYLFVNKTRVGMLVRAGSTHRDMVRALGVNIRMLYTLVFGLGALLAGLAGLMAGPLLAVQVGMGEQILILTFVVVVIGGIGSIRGAFIGAMIVGITDTLLRGFLPGYSSQLHDGVAGRRTRRRSVFHGNLSGDGLSAPDQAAGAVQWPRLIMRLATKLGARSIMLRAAGVAVLAIGLLLLPTVARALGDPALITLATRMIIYAIAAASLNLILGYGGLVSFGHAAYFGVGGYVVGILYFHFTSRRRVSRLHSRHQPTPGDTSRARWWSAGWSRLCSARCRCAPAACSSS